MIGSIPWARITFSSRYHLWSYGLNLPSLRVLFTGYTVSLLRYSFRYQCCPSPYWTGLLSTDDCKDFFHL